MASIHKERESITAVQMQQAIGRIDGSALSAGGRRCKQLLEDWDGDMQPDLVAPTVFAAVLEAMNPIVVPLIFGDELGPEILGAGRGGPTHWGLLRTQMFIEAAAGDMDAAIGPMLPDGQDWNSIFAASLDGAAELLEARLGEPDAGGWSWGDNHRTAPTHPLSALHPDLGALLNPPGVPCGGGFDTPNNGSFSTSAARLGFYNVTGMSVNRYIHDPSDWRNSRWIAPLGASGHPGSPHFADQSVLWSNVETIPQLWDWGDVATAAETTQLLQPAAKM